MKYFIILMEYLQWFIPLYPLYLFCGVFGHAGEAYVFSIIPYIFYIIISQGVIDNLKSVKSSKDRDYLNYLEKRNKTLSNLLSDLDEYSYCPLGQKIKNFDL